MAENWFLLRKSFSIVSGLEITGLGIAVICIPVLRFDTSPLDHSRQASTTLATTVRLEAKGTTRLPRMSVTC